MGFPSTLIVGDTAVWKDTPFVDDANNGYDSSRYALSYALRGPGSAIDLNAVADGTGWQTTLSNTTAAGLVAGLWWWAAILTAAGVRFTVAKGEVDVLADFKAAGASFDGRTAAEIALADAESALKNLTASGAKVGKYTIGARHAEYYTPAQLIEAISYWKLRVANERRTKAMSNGLGDPRNLYTRFGQPS